MYIYVYMHICINTCIHVNTHIRIYIYIPNLGAAIKTAGDSSDEGGGLGSDATLIPNAYI